MNNFKTLTLTVLAFLLLAGPALDAQKNKRWKADRDVVTLASENEQFSTLVLAIEKAGLTEALRSEGPFTVFAPLNRAFDDQPAVKVDTWMQPGMEEALAYILKYHVIAGAYSETDLIAAIRAGNGKATLMTLAGEELTAVIDGNSLELIDPDGDRSEIEKTNMMASNGIIHAVDEVLTPKTYTESSTSDVSPVGNLPTDTDVPSIADWAVKTESLQTLATALKAADLVGPLADEDDRYTVFAPVNAAFAEIPAQQLEQLLKPENKEQLRSLLSYHVVGGTYTATNLFELVEEANGGQAELVTATDEVLSMTVDNGEIILTDVRGNQIKVTEPNVSASNGVIHLVDGVLMNKPGKAKMKKGKEKQYRKDKKSDW